MLEVQETPLGHEILNDNFYILFANSNVDYENYKDILNARLGADLDFQAVDQVHGDGVYIFGEESPEQTEADAILLKKPGQCGIIKTADCLPIVLSNTVTKEAAIIHAGWRGVYNGILLKTLSHFVNQKPENLKLYIGPHISFYSYQVGPDLYTMFSDKFSFLTEGVHFNKDLLSPQHYKLNLQEILITHLETELASEVYSIRSQINTISHPLFHSYRELGDKAGRNLSFLVKRV